MKQEDECSPGESCGLAGMAGLGARASGHGPQPSLRGPGGGFKQMWKPFPTDGRQPGLIAITASVHSGVSDSCKALSALCWETGTPNSHQKLAHWLQM